MAAFYNGYAATMLRDMPFSAVQFAAYEQVKALLLWQLPRPGNELSSFESGFGGAMAGMLAGAVTTPLDVVKTFMQTRGHRTMPVSVAIATVLRAEGPAGLLRGVVPRVLWTAPQGSILFFVYELALSVLSGLRIGGSLETVGAPQGRSTAAGPAGPPAPQELQAPAFLASSAAGNTPQ